MPLAYINESTRVCYLAACYICIPLEPISETDIFVCASGITDHIKKMTGLHAQTIAHHHAQYYKIPTSSY